MDENFYFTLHQFCCTEITLNPGNPNIMNFSAQFSITLDTNRCVILGVTMLHSVSLLSLKQYALDFTDLRLQKFLSALLGHLCHFVAALFFLVVGQLIWHLGSTCARAN